MKIVAALLRMVVLALTVSVVLAGAVIGLLDTTNLGVAWLGFYQGFNTGSPSYSRNIQVIRKEAEHPNCPTTIKVEQSEDDDEDEDNEEIKKS
ncbi:MAG: hypothetical protein FJ134_12940 [Deltaproteobacteria bacterium]|nr:hypothetical protein [Deltaproteobacteria bacterium]